MIICQKQIAYKFPIQFHRSPNLQAAMKAKTQASDGQLSHHPATIINIKTSLEIPSQSVCSGSPIIFYIINPRKRYKSICSTKVEEKYQAIDSNWSFWYNSWQSSKFILYKQKEKKKHQINHKNSRYSVIINQITKSDKSDI